MIIGDFCLGMILTIVVEAIATIITVDYLARKEKGNGE